MKASCWAIIAVALLGAMVGAHEARADLSWEHVVTVRVADAKQPVARLKIYNNWTAQRHRLLLKYSVSGAPPLPPMRMPRPPFGTTALGTTAFAMTALAPIGKSTPIKRSPTGSHAGSLGWVQRLDDDRLVAYSSELRSYISEPRRGLLKRLRFDPWKKRAPQLSKEVPPSFSLEQRKRLGAEVRAVVLPHLKNVLKTYFRPLPQPRTFDDTTIGRGYRMTWLLNAGGQQKKDAQWVRIAFEWWLAEELPGDETIRQFQTMWRESLRALGWPSTSLWLNEFWPVLWQTMPEELHRATATLMPPETSPRAGFGGTPLRLYATVILPPLQRAAMGDVRLEIALTGRNTTSLPVSVFDAPADYTRVPIEPQLRQYEKAIEQIARGQTKDSKNVDAMGFTWQAWNQYSATTRSAMLSATMPAAALQPTR